MSDTPQRERTRDLRAEFRALEMRVAGEIMAGETSGATERLTAILRELQELRAEVEAANAVGLAGRH